METTVDSTTFRTALPEAPVSSGLKEPTNNTVGSEVNIPTPYLDYSNEHGKPFSVDYFGLGDRWADQNGGFPQEVGIIEGYFKDMIQSGAMANTDDAVKSELEKILKLTNMKDEHRRLVKIETVAAYIKFLSTKEDIERNARSFASSIYRKEHN